MSNNLIMISFLKIMNLAIFIENKILKYTIFKILICEFPKQSKIFKLSLENQSTFGK